MRARVAALLLAACLAAGAQMKMSVREVVNFVTSSVKLGHKDGDVAKYLRRVQLTERLDAGTVEDLQGLGAGPRTLEALDFLRTQSAGLPVRGIVPPPKELPAIPPPSAEEQRRIIEEVREYAMNYTKRLPDFICTQVTRRYLDPSGLEFWHKLDTVTAKLSYFEQKEDYRVVLVNNRPVDMSLDQLEGSTSSGEFGTMMREIFEKESEASFRWERWGKLRGRLMHVYAYSVPRPRSKWTISWQKRLQTTPGYRGLIYVDRDTSMVTRITLDAVNIEASFPVQQAGTVLDYDIVKISEQEHMLPLKFEMRMREGRTLVKNEVEFRLYRKFGAEASIKFDTPEELPAELLTEQPPAQ